MIIRAVLFDLDGTLKYNRPSGLDAFFQFTAELGLTLCADARRKVERWTHAYWADDKTNHAQAAQDVAWLWFNFTHGMLTTAGVDDASNQHTEAILAAFRERYQPEPYIPHEAHAVLSTLRANGYALGLVSNRKDDLTPIVVSLGLDGYFDFTLSGGQANSWKPDTRIFLMACEMAHAQPHECLYVGDNFYADVLGAQNAGLVPVLLDPNDVFPEAACARIACLDDLMNVADLVA